MFIETARLDTEVPLFYNEYFSDEYLARAHMQCMQFSWLSGSWKAMAGRMSIRRYLKPIDGLPDPKGSLSTTIPSAVIASANRDDRHLVEFGGQTPPTVTVQRIDVVTSHTASQRPLFHADGMITLCAYYLWRVYN